MQRAPGEVAGETQRILWVAWGLQFIYWGCRGLAGEVLGEQRIFGGLFLVTGADDSQRGIHSCRGRA